MRPGLLVVLAGLSCCKRDSAGGDGELVRANRLDKAPALERSLRVGLDTGVIYLGNEIDSEVARPGGSITVTHYINVTGKPPKGGKLAVALAGEDAPAIDQPASPMQRAYPPKRWRPGDVIRDRQVVDIPESWSESSAQIVVSFGETTARVGRVSIGRGDYAVRASATPIEIDGRPGDRDWRRAAWSPWFTTASGGRAMPGSARAKLLWDREHLYALVEVTDETIHSPYTARDDPLWKADVVEIFIDADRNRRGYIELQVNPRGAIFDAFFPITRAQKHHFEWNSKMRAAVEVDGRPDAAGSRDRSWVAEMAIPHVDVKGMAADMAVATPPQPGDRWNLNVVRVDKPKGSGITASTWNPITIRDFHAPGRMLTVTFEP